MDELAEFERDARKAGAIVDNLIRQKDAIEERIHKFREETGEEPPAGLIAELEEEKQNISELTKDINTINKTIKTLRVRKKSPARILWRIFRPILKTVIWLAFPVMFFLVAARFDFSKSDEGTIIALALLGGWVVYTVLLIVLYLRGIAKKERERQQAVADMLNGFIGQNIDEVLESMPPPTKSVKHRGSQYISYYWIKSRRNVSGGSIPVVQGISLFSASSSVSKDTLTLFVDPATSAVVKWSQTSE